MVIATRQKYPQWSPPRLARHKNCRDGLRCTGPGCAVKSGKTQAKRKGKRNER